MLEGEGAVCAPGVKSRGGLVVQVTDETGRPVDGTAVSFRLPEEGPGGVFARGMRTEIATTTPDGRAAVYGLECNGNPGPFQIRVTAVKDQVRAGLIVSQYVSNKATAAVGKSLRPRSRRKWWITAGIAAGAAAGAVLATSGQSKAGPAATSAPPPQIGLPTITVGRP